MRAQFHSSYVFAVLLTCTAVACSRQAPQSQPPKASVPTHQLPTATEVFQLRSECAKLGSQILNNNTIGSALTQSVVSNYDEKSGRCYVNLTVQSADLTQAPQTMSQYLYDGQTNELLATTSIKKGVRGGIAYKTNALGFDAVNEYIESKMNDPAQQ
jgi:hypothetical protein